MESYRLFFELFEKNVILGRIWFECTWTVLFGAMELGRFYSVLTLEPLTYAFFEAGAIALTAVTHTQLCQPLSACYFMTMGGFAYPTLVEIFTSSSPCTSTQVLQAFTWLSALLCLYHLPRHLALF